MLHWEKWDLCNELEDKNDEEIYLGDVFIAFESLLVFDQHKWSTFLICLRCKPHDAESNKHNDKKDDHTYFTQSVQHVISGVVKRDWTLNYIEEVEGTNYEPFYDES